MPSASSRSSKAGRRTSSCRSTTRAERCRRGDQEPDALVADGQHVVVRRGRNPRFRRRQGDLDGKAQPHGRPDEGGRQAVRLVQADRRRPAFEVPVAEGLAGLLPARPGREAWIMQAYTNLVDKTLTAADLPKLGGK